MKFCIILSTRPEIIKLAPLIKIFKKKRIKFFIINTGQHYDKLLSKVFLKEFNIPKSKYTLNNPLKNNGLYFDYVFSKIEKILNKEKPDSLIVQGDTNTALIGALSGEFFKRKNLNSKYKLKIIHIEAGLRSFDRTMPEEINRIIIDRLSDILFVPTNTDYKNLINENLVKNKKIYIVGNTINDAINLSLSKIKKNDILKRTKLIKKKYFLLTIHRPENIKNHNLLKKIIINMEKLGNFYKNDIIFPIHLHTKKQLSNITYKKLKRLKIIEPLGYYDFLKLQKECEIVITDSGGIQEEASILGVPCITIRNNTERQITIIKKVNVLSKSNFNSLKKSIITIRKRKIKPYKLFGFGNISLKIFNKII